MMMAMQESGQQRIEDTLFVFAEEEESNGRRAEPAIPWKVIIADDEEEVHRVTKSVMRDFVFEGRKIRLLSAYSGAETVRMVKRHPDCAVILLDVVMETDDAGLKVVRAIRDEFENRIVQIILRTGQPGQAPESEIIRKYAINDYKSKVELTAIKLYTTITASLRAFQLSHSLCQVNGKLAVELSERKAVEAALKKSEENYRSIFDTASDAILVHEPVAGKIRDVNPAMCRMYGYTAKEAKGLSMDDLNAGQAPHTREAYEEMVKEAMMKTPGIFEWKARAKGGRTFWVEVNLSRIRRGEQTIFISVVRDITERKQFLKQLQLLASVFDNTSEGILITDPDGRIERVNPSFTRITGYTPGEITGKNPREFKSDRNSPRLYEKMWTSLSSAGQWAGEILNRRKDGSIYPARLSITAIGSPVGHVRHYVGLFHDITEVKHNEKQLKYQAYHDALTGLPNRQLFGDRLAQALVHGRRTGREVAILFLDLDNFKDINDSIGHHMGDLFLKAVAARLQECCRKEDTVSRFGGDEFLIILTDLMEGVRYAIDVVRRIKASLSVAIVIDGHEMVAKTSIGVTVSPQDGDDVETLLKNADMAMYRVKESGKNDYAFYTKSMNTTLLKRLRLEADLKNALEKGEFLLHFQPKVNIASGRICGCEALIRWRRAGGGLVSPSEFIPLAEETGLILPMGEWVLQRAAKAARQWHLAGLEGISVAVNLSARQFQDKSLAQKVADILAQEGLPPELLNLEVTENTVMKDVAAAIETMGRIEKMGVSISIDDFGTGYSSLNYLKRFPIDVLKIDSSFVRDIPEDPDDVAIAKTILSLARNMKLKVVAEGVEKDSQLRFMAAHGCDEIQGYLFSRPLEEAAFTRLLREDRRL